MPRLLFDFRCTRCRHVHEELVESGVTDTDCPVCAGRSERLITPIRFRLEGHTGHFPTAADKWARQHEKAGRQPVDE